MLIWGALKKSGSGIFPLAGNHVRIAWRYASGSDAPPCSTTMSEAASTAISPFFSVNFAWASAHTTRPRSDSRKDAHWLW